ncbi:hypothetical protein PoB_001937100 [Plakobranchus ocellatus]|uniref:Transposase n=1 Tax=Plakobranchus ocellatus TaxID=259542 RepID=A0AAV3ZAA2_9GAST|nr:hypothetical protein PoB_001937100 [Plakobranchus ocellatus]
MLAINPSKYHYLTRFGEISGDHVIRTRPVCRAGVRPSTQAKMRAAHKLKAAREVVHGHIHPTRTGSESESEDENIAVYDADTEVDDGPDVDFVVNLDQDQQNHDIGEWQRNTNGFPKLPRFSAQLGIKVALSDDPSLLEIYKLFITDELINSWKIETNRYARAISSSKDQ